MLQRALILYRTDWALRHDRRDPMIARLESRPAPKPFPCDIAATLFGLNYNIQSLLVSRDPLVKQTEDALRTDMERLSKESPDGVCTFRALLDAYLAFARRHCDEIVARSKFPAYFLPLGIQPIRVEWDADFCVEFPSRASWAAFVSNKELWMHLPGSPPIPFAHEHVRSDVVAARARKGSESACDESCDEGLCSTSTNDPVYVVLVSVE